MHGVNNVWCLLGIVIISTIHLAKSQIPPRLQIPGALLVQDKPSPFRQGRLLIPDSGPPPSRLRRPIPQSAPIRPVVEDNEEPISFNTNFDDEVNKLGLSLVQSAINQANEEEQPTSKPANVAFRPERPVPILRENIRDNFRENTPPPRPVQHVRQEIPRPVFRQPEVREEVPVRQPARHQHKSQPPPQQAYRPAPRPTPRQPPQYLDEEGHGRTKKPPVQILRKYRTDNPDGSITWGYENEDGTFKEETLGVDCITRGKYGYVDPDGVKREYTYETGNKCDEPDPEDEDLPPGKQAPNIPSRKPQGQQQYRSSQIAQQYQTQ